MKKTGTTCNILVINPGSTSTKLTLFRNNAVKKTATFFHSAGELKRFDTVSLHTNYRLGLIRSFVRASGVPSLSAIAARGGLLRPIKSGVYRVNAAMLRDLKQARFGSHASNLGALCAAPLAKEYRCSAYIADPVVVDEMDAVAKISGIPAIRRRSLFHALNQKSAAGEIAARLGKKYESCNFIVAHLGGGISVGAHCRGRVVDVNNALDGDGPFSPERAGSVPAGDLLRLYVRSKGSLETFYKKIVGRGGLTAYCGTSDLPAIMRKIGKGDKKSQLVVEAMIYRISKEIAMHGATLRGKVDAIILTGGMAHNRRIVRGITERVSFLAPVHVVPGEREMESLALAVLRVLNHQEKALSY
jgi:butyrate kinase